jgi:outer membrane protein assembly factor BamB
LYIGGYDQNLYALDPQTGEEMWRLKLGGSISNPQPHIAEDDALYVGCIDGNVYAIDIVQRKEKWRFRTAGWILASPMPAGDLIYFISSDGNIYCIDKDGALVWKFMTDAYMDGSTEALVHKGVVYCGSSNNNFYALDAMMGKELWRFRTDGEIISAPLMHENKLYFGSFDCHFYCIDIKGREVWRFKTSSSVKWKVPPASEWFEFEVKIDEEPDESIREYGKGVNVASAEFSKSEYSFKSEYASTSEYRTKSEYR